MNEKEMTIGLLKVSIDGQFEKVNFRLDKIESRLDKIEKDIFSLGNGKPGIGVRVDRLESYKKISA